MPVISAISENSLAWLIAFLPVVNQLIISVSSKPSGYSRLMILSIFESFHKVGLILSLPAVSHRDIYIICSLADRTGIIYYCGWVKPFFMSNNLELLNGPTLQADLRPLHEMCPQLQAEHCDWAFLNMFASFTYRSVYLHH